MPWEDYLIEKQYSYTNDALQKRIKNLEKYFYTMRVWQYLICNFERNI